VIPSRRHRSAARLAAVALLGAWLTACGETSAPVPVSTPSPTPRPLQACAPTTLPQTGFVLDAPRSGVLSVGRYSPNGDIQAALIHFGFETGMRNVYTDIPASPAGAPAAGPAGTHDLLIICDAIQFRDRDGAQGFIHAFGQLRLDQSQQQVTAPKVGDQSAAFKDHDQSFSGYAIEGTNGAELASSSGSVFSSVSVFGPNADLGTATGILTAMQGVPR